MEAALSATGLIVSPDAKGSKWTGIKARGSDICCSFVLFLNFQDQDSVLIQSAQVAVCGAQDTPKVF